MSFNLKKSARLLIFLFLAVLLAFISLKVYMSQDYSKIEVRRESLRAKIEQLKEGDDESLVLKILGRPTFTKIIESKDLSFRTLATSQTVLLYRYDIILGKMPLTIEGASRASISVYIDDATKKVVKLDWFIF